MTPKTDSVAVLRERLAEERQHAGKGYPEVERRIAAYEAAIAALSAQGEAAPLGSDAVTETHELPELPQCWTGWPVTVTWAEDGERTTREVYTAEQMRQYALAALAARTGKGEANV